MRRFLEDGSICPANENICIQARVRYVTTQVRLIWGNVELCCKTTSGNAVCQYMIQIQIIYMVDAYMIRAIQIRLVLNWKLYVLSIFQQ